MLDLFWPRLCFIVFFVLEQVKGLPGTVLNCPGGTKYCAVTNTCERHLKCILIEYDLVIDCISHKYSRRHHGIRKKDWLKICSDRLTKPAPVCSHHENSCDYNTKCFSATETCDRRPDCANGADEMGCKECSSGERKCDLGRNCFSVIETCDGVRKCADGQDEENCAQVNCSQSVPVLCGASDNCTDKTVRQNCSGVSLDEINLSFGERVGLLGAFTFCLLVLVLVCMTCCCKCCCCSRCVDPKHPKPVSGTQSQPTQEGIRSELLPLRTRDGYIGPTPIAFESPPLTSHIYSYNDGQELQPTSVLLPPGVCRGLPLASSTGRLPPVRFPGPHFDPELPTYESLFPDRQFVNLAVNSEEKT